MKSIKQMHKKNSTLTNCIFSELTHFSKLQISLITRFSFIYIYLEYIATFYANLMQSPSAIL